MPCAGEQTRTICNAAFEASILSLTGVCGLSAGQMVKAPENGIIAIKIRSVGDVGRSFPSTPSSRSKGLEDRFNCVE